MSLLPVPGYLMLALLWSIYCAVHSALISVTITRWFEKKLGTGYRYYRLFFNSFSLATLVPLILYSYSERWQGAALFSWEGYWRVVRYALITVAALLAVAGARHYSMLQFLGIRQIREGRRRGAMTESGNIETNGVLGLVRHPWYTAVFVLLWANNLNMAAITVNTVLSTYLVIGTFLEEKKLVRQFGDEYRRYQDKVSMFLPLKWLAARFQAAHEIRSR
jgi:protein-S-isoprenylcysteine O-methyltransferase Ste14